jgi:hypothetical protein
VRRILPEGLKKGKTLGEMLRKTGHYECNIGMRKLTVGVAPPQQMKI